MMVLLKYSDKELIGLLQQGEIKAFDELYYRYVPRLMCFARSYILDEQEAEDAVQEIFIKIWEKRKSMDGSKNFKSYLFQSVKNHLLNLIRDRRNNCQLEDIPDDHFPREDNLLENLSYKELENATFGLIASLPKVQQEVFTLSRLQGMTNNEIAIKLNLSKRTVEHHIYLSVKYLKGKLTHMVPLYGGLIIIFHC